MKNLIRFLTLKIVNYLAFLILIGMLLPFTAFSQITISSNSTTATVNQTGDPVTVTGSGNLSVSDLANWFGDGISVLVETSGDISVTDNISKTSGGDCYLTLKANGSILFPAKKIISNSSASGALSLVFWADADDGGAGSGTVQLWCDITTNGGGVWMGGGDGTALWTPYTGASDLTVGDGPATGTALYNGVNLYQTTTITTGAGNVSIYGEYSYGTNGGTGFYSHDWSEINTTSGNVVITGINNNNQNVGVWNRTAITTSSGNISMTGSGYSNEWGGLNSDWGLMLYSSSGNITLDGTNNHSSGPSIRFGGGGKVGYDGTILTSSTSNVIFRGDRYVLGTSSINTSGTFTIEPKSASFPSAFTWPSNLSLVSTVSGLTIGKVGNTADMSLGTALDIAGPLSLYGGTVTASSNTTCTDLNINSGTIFTLNSGASLITTGTITNNGTIEVKQSISDDNKWHLISMPNAVTTANTFLDMYLQHWDEEGGDWQDVTNTATTLFPAKGYSLWSPSAKASFTYTGTPNTGNQSIAITDAGTGTNRWMNFVGNPYPSYLDWDAVTGFGSKYTWNGTAYLSYTQSGSYGTGSRYVAPMEGFFIYKEATVADNFSLTNDMRTHTSSKKAGNNKGLQRGLIITASNGSYNDDLWIVLDEAASEDFELERDAWKFLSSTEGISQLYSYCSDGKLSIDVRPETQIVQLGFTNDVVGNYKLSLSEIADIPEVYLEDTKTEIFHNLQTGDYEFSWNPEMDNESRFKLHFKAVGINEHSNQSNILIYAADKQIFIKGVEKGEVIITDIMGRVILQDELSVEGSIRLPCNLQTGVYIVTVQNGNEIKTEKVFIK